MAEDYLDPLQGIVRQTIREELSRLEPRFQRITMSQDTDGHPAELYGAGGKIYYRKEGGSGVELDAGGSGSLWESPGAVTELIAPEPVLLEDDLTLYDGTTISPELHFRVPLDEGFSGFKIDYHSTDGMLRFQDRATSTSVMTLSDAGRLNLWDDLWLVAGKEVNFGSPYTAYIKRNAASPYELVFYDEDVGAEKTLSELLTGGGAYLPLAGGTMVGILNMAGYDIAGIGDLKANSSGAGIVLQNDLGADTAWMGRKLGAVYLHEFFLELDMNNNAITHLPHIAVHTDADGLQIWDSTKMVRTVRLASSTYALEVWNPVHMHGNKIVSLGAPVAGTDAARLQDVTDVAKISNCTDTVKVDCKADCNIDITVPSGKVVTFIRS